MCSLSDEMYTRLYFLLPFFNNLWQFPVYFLFVCGYRLMINATSVTPSKVGVYDANDDDDADDAFGDYGIVSISSDRAWMDTVIICIRYHSPCITIVSNCGI